MAADIAGYSRLAVELRQLETYRVVFSDFVAASRLACSTYRQMRRG
jgi:hypothetical protein